MRTDPKPTPIIEEFSLRVKLSYGGHRPKADAARKEIVKKIYLEDL